MNDPTNADLVLLANRLRATDDPDKRDAAAAIDALQGALRATQLKPAPWPLRLLVATVADWTPKQRLVAVLGTALIVAGAATAPITAVANLVGGAF